MVESRCFCILNVWRVSIIGWVIRVGWCKGENISVMKAPPFFGSALASAFLLYKSLQRNLIFLYVMANITIEFEVEFQDLRFKLRCSNLHSNFFFRFFSKKFRYIFNGKKISNGYLDFIFHCTVNKVRWKKGAKYEVQILNGCWDMTVGIVFGI